MQSKDLQGIRTVKQVTTTADNITLTEVINQAKTYVFTKTKNSTKQITDDQREQILVNYINDNIGKWSIKALKNKKGMMDKNKLIELVIEGVLRFGVLEKPLKDPDIIEIQGIGRWLWVIHADSKGEWLLDDFGARAKFSDPEDQMTTLKKLIEGDSTPISNEYQVVNGRTVQGYRIAINHPSSVTHSNDYPDENGYCTFTLRKFKDSYIPLETLIESGTCTDQMGRLLKAMGNMFRFVVIGATGSGKTTLCRSLLNYIADDMRVICIQSPSEIDLRRYEKNKEGVYELMNNRVMWEANPNAKTKDSTGKEITHSASLNNLMMATLRNTPDVIAINEARHPSEFNSSILIAQAGHLVNFTYHAETPYEGCAIYAQKVVEATGQAYDIALMNVTNALNFIICQKKLPGGSRRITDIAEICGVDENNKNLPKLNMIYTYEVTKVEHGDPNNPDKITKMEGIHKKVGNLSPELRKKLSYKGIIGEDLERLDPDYTKMAQIDINDEKAVAKFRKENYTGKI